MGKGNHHQFKKLLIVQKILLFSIRGNVKRQVWRMWMLSLGCIEFIAGLFWVSISKTYLLFLLFFFLWSLDGAYASNSQSDPDFRQAVGPTAHHYPGLVTTKNALFIIMFQWIYQQFTLHHLCQVSIQFMPCSCKSC